MDRTRPVVCALVPRAALLLLSLLLSVGGVVPARALGESQQDAAIASLQSAVAALQSQNSSQASQISTLQTNVTSLQSTVHSQASQITELQSQASAQAALLKGFSRHTDTSRTDGQTYTELYLTGLNLHIVNGLGATNGEPSHPTDTVNPVTNGLGNVIIGYNGLRGGGTDVRSGSHNLVLGDGSNYGSYGGLVAGESNAALAPYASVLGGLYNIASGTTSAVLGGYRNTAGGLDSTVSGGGANTASESVSSVSGGYHNTAAGLFSSVSGGSTDTETAQYGWAAGSLHSP